MLTIGVIYFAIIAINAIHCMAKQKEEELATEWFMNVNSKRILITNLEIVIEDLKRQLNDYQFRYGRNNLSYVELEQTANLARIQRVDSAIDIVAYTKKTMMRVMVERMEKLFRFEFIPILDRDIEQIRARLTVVVYNE